MFTGIVKALGKVESLQPRGGDLRMRISSPGIDFRQFDIGESISVNGVCLTAVELDGNGFAADVSQETIAVTALSILAPGTAVNLEPALAVGDRLGGHIVSGHVDCVGEVLAHDVDARSIRLAVGIPQEYRRYVAKKGSVCIDGVSLTINAVSGDGFEVNIIPHTAEVTIIGEYRVGTRVNVEVDLLARYLERLLSADDSGNISEEFLRVHGYV